MHRLIGFAMILVGGIGTGYLYGQKFRGRIEDMQEIQRIFQMLLSEIAYSSMPLPYAFLEIANKCDEASSMWLRNLSKELLKKEPEPLYKVWKKEAERYARMSRLRPQDIRKLTEFGKHMGYLDMQMQKNTILLFLEAWEEEVLKSRKELAVKMKLSLCMGSMGSLMLVILLW